MATDIKVISLQVVTSVSQMAVSTVWQSPPGMSCLPYMQPSTVEIWSSATQNRANATLSAESDSGLVVLDFTGTRYFWARAKDADGNLGDFYPASATAGIVGVSKSADPGPNSVGSTELKDDSVAVQHMKQLSVGTAQIINVAVTTAKIANLAVTNAKIDSLAANKITAGTINALIEIIGPTVTGGVIRTSAGSSRAELTSSQNSLDIYVSGVNRARFGNPSASNPMLQVNIPWIAATLVGGVSGAGVDVAAVYIQNTASVGLMAESVGNLNTSHGFRGAGGGSGWTTANRGRGIVGVSRSSGGQAFYSEVGGYGPFTGVHDAFILKGINPDVGDIVCDWKIISRNGIDDTISEVYRSYFEKDKRAIGIMARVFPFDVDAILAALPLDHYDNPTFIRKILSEKYNRMIINSVGEGQLNVCGLGGDIEAGDLICTSALPGKGMRQNNLDGSADDLLRNFTVARARESFIFNDPYQVAQIACVYSCG